MIFTQVYNFVNTATAEALGESAVVAEDLSNIIEIGRQLEQVKDGYDNYVRALTNHIGKVVFSDRKLDLVAPSLVRDSWEYGSILEKIRCDIPEASENETWELVDGQSYNQDKFYKPQVHAEFFNKRVTFEIDLSITDRQVKESFSNAAQMGAFVAMLYNSIDKSMVIKLNELTMRTINNMIGETIATEYTNAGVAYNAGSTVKAVNLLYLYNTKYGTTLTAENALTDDEFLRFAAFVIKSYVRRLRTPSTLFNVNGTKKFTPTADQHVIMWGEFLSAAEIYLYNGNGQFLTDKIKLPEADTVEYWQGTGTDYGFASASAINITTTGGNVVQTSGILACLFDRDALGVANLERRVRTHTNDKAEFVNNFVKADAGYWNDFNENFVVFFVA